MRIIYFLLFTLFLSLSVFAQKTPDQIKKEIKTFDGNRRYLTKYDKFTDKTTVFYKGQSISGLGMMITSFGSVTINLAFGFDTQNLNQTAEHYVLYFKASGKDWTFLKNQQLYALADGERINFGEGLRDSEITRSVIGVGTKETLAFPLTREEVEKLAKAKKLEIKLANMEFKIKDGEKQALLNMLSLGKL